MGKLISRFVSCNRGQGFADSVLLIFLSVGAAASSVIIERHVTTLWNVSLFALTSVSSASSDGASSAAASAAGSNVRAVSHTMIGGNLTEDNGPRVLVMRDGERASVSTEPASDLIREDPSDS